MSSEFEAIRPLKKPDRGGARRGREDEADLMDGELAREVDEALAGMSIEELEALSAPAPTAPAGEGEQKPAGALKRGRIIAIHGEDIFVDMGGKSQGWLAAIEFGPDEAYKVGDVIEVIIERYDRQDGMLVLSRSAAKKEIAWRNVAEGVIVEARVTGHNKGGLELDIGGSRAFMPAGQIDLAHVEDLKQFVGQRLTCEVTDVNREERNIIVSRKAVMQREQLRRREELMATLQPGEVLEGVVRKIMDFGAFVDIGGVDGLVHISDLAWNRVEKVEDVVKEGQRVKVKVLKVDPESGRIGLGLKQVAGDPWEKVPEKFHAGTITTGRVVKLMPFGAFVELEPGVEGLVHVSEITWQQRVADPKHVLNVGDVVDVVVLEVDTERQRIALSIKQVEESPWAQAGKDFLPEMVVEGTVTRTADFGAFIEISPGIEGLVHVSELAEHRVSRVGDVVRPGQRVKVRILEVDPSARRIGMSMRRLEESVNVEEANRAQDERHQQAKPRKKPLKGGLDGGGLNFFKG
jgi:small subunit ribosomal protein S1